LTFEHPDGASKARVLAHAGFDAARPWELERSLREQHLSLDAHYGRSSPFGDKYEITGWLAGSKGRVWVTSVWIIGRSEPAPRLITIIPETHE
jgi:hypothetical protein